MANEQVVYGEIVPVDDSGAHEMARAHDAAVVQQAWRPEHRGPGDAIPFALLDKMHPLELTEEQIKVLTAPIDPRDVRVRVDASGERKQPYLPWQAAAERFDAAFGPGHWSIIPVSEIAVLERRETRTGKALLTVAQQWALIVDGQLTQFIVVSDHSYFEGGPPPHEALKSLAYFRVLKALGGGRELNNEAWVRAWLKKYGGNPPEMHITPEDVIEHLDGLRARLDEERVLGALKHVLKSEKAAQEVAAWMKERYGDEWLGVIAQHLGSFPGFVAAQEIRVLYQHISGGKQEQATPPKKGSGQGKQDKPRRPYGPEVLRERLRQIAERYKDKQDTNDDALALFSTLLGKHDDQAVQYLFGDTGLSLEAISWALARWLEPERVPQNGGEALLHGGGDEQKMMWIADEVAALIELLESQQEPQQGA